MLCKKIFDRKLDAEMESFEGGPKQIVKETVEKLSHILSEMQIKIKIRSKIVDSDEIFFPWRVYRSMLIHTLLWSINISNSRSCIMIDVDIENI